MLYLDNHGKDQAITFVFQRDPTETQPLPGPLPPAYVENDTKTITASGGAGVIAMNQATDQAWVEGPGTLTQITTRAPGPPPEPVPFEGEAADRKTADAASSRITAPPAAAPPRPTAVQAQNERQDVPPDQAAQPKPNTRAGRPLSDKVISTICFSEGMEFNGRSVDREQHPAGRADFYGVSTARIEDSLLHADEAMIAYTDRPVPFASLGALNKPKPKAGDMPVDPAGEARPAEDEAQLASIECYRNAVAITRKVDPMRPEVLQKQRIEAEELLVYDRRTGNFHVPGKGKVYLYDRSDNSRSEGMNPDGANAPPEAKPVAGRRV